MVSSVHPAASPRRVTAALVLTTLLWGGSFVFNKIGFRDIPPITFMFFRFSLAAVIMGMFCVRRLPLLDRDIIGRGAIVGLALAAANLSFVLGVSATTVSRAGFLNNLFVLIIPLLSFFLWRERVDRASLCGLCIAMAGLWQLARGGTEGFGRGDLFSTVCALFISLHIILVSTVLRREDVYLVTFVQFVTVAAVGGCLLLVLPARPYTLSTTAVGSLFYCAIFPTVICFTLQNTYQRFSTPTQAGLIYTLDPVWSMLGGTLFLGERLNSRELLGCSLIFAAVLVPLLLGRLREVRYRVPLRECGTLLNNENR